MSDETYWVYVVSVKEGAFEKFRDLVGELVKASRKEADTVGYHFSTSEDGRTVHIFEHDKNSAAVVSHVQQTFAPLADRFVSLARTMSVTVYGNPDATAREMIDQWGATYIAPLDGFIHRG